MAMLHVLCVLFVLFSEINCERKCVNGKAVAPYPATVKDTSKLLEDLRKLMAQNGIGGYIIPTTDEHQMEYVAERFKRLQEISGFKGSAGTGVVTLTKAAIWVDGRYDAQADMEVDCNWEIMKYSSNLGTLSVNAWIKKELAGGSVSADPRLISLKKQESILKELGTVVSWKDTNENLVDKVWVNRPTQIIHKIFVYPLKYTGKAFPAKLDDVREDLKRKNVMAVVVQSLDGIAWLLNLRGRDIPYNPMFYAYVIVTETTVSLFVDPAKLTSSVKAHLCPANVDPKYCVKVFDYTSNTVLPKAIKDLVASSTRKIWLTPETSIFIAANIPANQLYMEESSVQLAKIQKNEVELNGMRVANNKDSVAIMEYFVWLKKQIKAGNKVTELSGAEKLRQFKSHQESYVELSFAPISAYGPHGAIMHYIPNKNTDIEIRDDSLYLIDSGAQFYDGTTDITRTIHLGIPTAKHKEMYTYVLKGVIGLASVVFPDRTTGNNIDIMAREPLWKKGLEYMHGTGHGIGSFLSVHDGPAYISGRIDKQGQYYFRENMVFSNEPGYYEDGDFGIRLETAMSVAERSLQYKTKNKTFYGFDILTWIPFEKKLINVGLLTKEEIDWLNEYNGKTRSIMGPILKKQGKQEVYDYMMDLTTPITNSEKIGFSKMTIANWKILACAFLLAYYLFA